MPALRIKLRIRLRVPTRGARPGRGALRRPLRIRVRRPGRRLIAALVRAARRGTATLLIAAMIFATPWPIATAQGGDVVERVVVEGNRQYGRDVITHAAKLKPGDLLDEARLARVFDDVWKTGFFEDLTVAVEKGAMGTVVVIQVVEKPIVRNVEFRGNKALTKSTIDDKLKEASVTLPVDAPLDQGRLKSIEDVLRRLLDERGYRFATIDLKFEDVTPGVVRAIFQVDEGTKVRINDVKFTGNDVFGSTRLRYTMKKTREHWFLSWITSHDILNDQTFEEDLQRVRDLYLNRGYIDINVGTPKIDIYEHKVTRKGKVKRRINIEIPLEEGEPYDVGDITIDGNVEIATEDLMKMIPLRKGDRYSKERLTQGRDAIDDAYGQKGYYKVFTNPKLTPDREKKTVDIAVSITEDKIYTVRSFEFAGNEGTRDKVLRREILIEEGDVFNTRKFRNSLLKLNQLGYFTVKDVPEINEVPGENEVDILVKGEETGRNEINIGGGYSGSLGFFGTLSFATRNFLGRGEAFSVQVQSGANSDTYSLSFAEPWLFDRPLFSSGDIYKRKVEYTDFTKEGNGGDVILGAPLGSFGSWRVRYSYEDVLVEERQPETPVLSPGNQDPLTDPDAERRERLFNASGITSSITPIFIFNTVDNPYDPTRGLRFTFSTEYAPGELGGNFTFVKPTVETTFFLPIKRIRHVFATHFEVGWVEPLEGAEVPVFERFFLGGERTIRGLELRSVSPVDSGGFRIGGNKMVLFNQEYQIPIAKSPLMAVLFFDAGNAFDDDQSLDFTDLRMTAGVELRITLPVLGQPLRFIYGYNLDPLPDEKPSDFQFTIGSNF